MYETIMPHLARAGFRAIAFDLAGTGRSHKNCRGWTVQQYAADVLEACGSLHTVPYTVIGGRFGASVAVEMLLASPTQVTGAVLDGVPGLAPEELRKMSAPSAGLSPKIADEAGYRSFAFDVRARILKDGDPGFELTQENLPLVYELMRDYLELGYDAIVAGSRSASSGSTSIAMTRRATSSSARVSDPSPGPTSTTTSSPVMPDSRTIRRTVLASMTKFCPRCLVGRRSSSAAS
jgi:pimeloyl-ACP methyl ester carboxylesterase